MAKLRDYDFVAARKRLVDRVNRTTKIVLDRAGDVSFDRTRLLRELQGSADAVRFTQHAVLAALSRLAVEDGGLWKDGTLATALDSQRPLVRALLLLGAHPCHPGFARLDWYKGPDGAGPILARELAATRPAWSVKALEAAVVEGVTNAFGDVDVDPDRLTYEQAPGSDLGAYLSILGYVGLFDAIGAFDPSFERRDALVADWWLLQPVSPNLNNHEAADKVGLQLAGYLPPSAVDVPGRVVMVCYPRVAMSDESRREAIEQQKWIKGHLHVQWRVGEPPLDGPSFDLLPKLDGAYKHSSELPPFARRPRARSTAEMKFAIALEPCPGCGLRDARGLELFGNDDLWTFGGRCPECRTVRTHSFETTGAPYLVNPRAYELGEGPSQIISEETFRAELSRVWPAVVSDPTTIGTAKGWYAAENAIRIVATCLNELIKLGVADRSDLEAELERLFEIAAGYGADRARLQRLEASAKSELRGDPADETRLLVHPESGFSMAVPGHPVRVQALEEACVKLSDLPVQIAFRFDEGTTARETIREHAGEMEHVRVVVHERWAIRIVTRYPIAGVTPIQWANLRNAMRAGCHWGAHGPTAIWPARTRIASPDTRLALLESAMIEARAKAKDLDAMPPDEVRQTVDLLLEMSTQDQPPAAAFPRVLLEMVRGRVEMMLSPRVAQILLRNGDEIEHFHDFRGWCSQCLWAIDNRTAAIE